MPRGSSESYYGSDYRENRYDHKNRRRDDLGSYKRRHDRSPSPKRYTRRRSVSKTRSPRSHSKRLYYYKSRSRSISKPRKRYSKSRSRSSSLSRRGTCKKRLSPRSKNISRSRSRSKSHSRNYVSSSPKKREYKKKLDRSEDRPCKKERSVETFCEPLDQTDLRNNKTIANTSVDQNEEHVVTSDKIKCEFTDTYETYQDDLLEPLDKEKIHKEIEEKLRLALAKEGKIYPPPKPEASHPVFANDGSFLEVFKKMQEQANQNQQHENANKHLKPVCKRRGGKILKTGIVEKPRAECSNNDSDSKDFWSIYLQEVKKYKNASCDLEGNTRLLMK